MSATTWNDMEEETLQGLPWLAQLVYLRGLRRFMDYSTGIVGVKRGISYQCLKETLYIEPTTGRPKKDVGLPSLAKVRNAIRLLTDAGLIKTIPHAKKLIFLLCLAKTDQSDQKKHSRPLADLQQTFDSSDIVNDNNDIPSTNTTSLNDTDVDKHRTPPKSVIRCPEHTGEKKKNIYLDLPPDFTNKGTASKAKVAVDFSDLDLSPPIAKPTPAPAPKPAPIDPSHNYLDPRRHQRAREQREALEAKAKQEQTVVVAEPIPETEPKHVAVTEHVAVTIPDAVAALISPVVTVAEGLPIAAPIEALIERKEAESAVIAATTGVAKTEIPQLKNTLPVVYEPATQDRAYPDPAWHVFKHWIITFNKQGAILDRNRRQAINGRLKDGYTVEDLMRAITGCAQSPWHMGVNKDRVTNNDIGLICKDAQHVDQFIDYGRREPIRTGIDDFLQDISRGSALKGEYTCYR